MAGRIILGIANPSLDANGGVAPGSTLTVYQNRTTTLASIYSDAALLTPLANPLTCDSAGRFPEIWGTNFTLYSVKWSVSGATPITYDDIENTTSFNTGSWIPVDASGAGLAFAVLRATYIQIGSWFWCDVTLTYPTPIADVRPAIIGGLPAISANVAGVGGAFIFYDGLAAFGAGTLLQNTTTFAIANSVGTPLTNANLQGATVRTQFMLPTV